MLALSEGQPAFMYVLRGVRGEKVEGEGGGRTLLKGETRSARFCVCTRRQGQGSASNDGVLGCCPPCF